MTFKTTITKKGQMTIPKRIREALGLEKNSQVEIELKKDEGVARIKGLPDLSEVKGMIKDPKRDVMEARKDMEKNYQRQ